MSLTPVLLDVCVPVHNALPLVKRCLASIKTCTSATYRLIVHDDASDSETYDWVRNALMVPHFQNAILLRSDRQCWFTTSVNRCLAMTKAHFVAVLNSDVELRELKWFERLLAAWLQRGGLIGTPDNLRHPGDAYGVDGKVQGHLWFFRRADMQKVGLLDESSGDTIHIRSDDEWSARWRHYGFNTSLLPSLEHVHGDESCPGGGASWGRNLMAMPKQLSEVAEARAAAPRLIVER